MHTRTHYSSGSKWEPVVGYSRGIRVGNSIEISGTCAVGEDGKVYGKDDPYLQTTRAIEIIKEALESLGGSLEDVVRTRIYVTDIKHWEEVGKAHGETFGSILPVTTMIEVSGLISPEFLVEVEATAIVI